MRRGGRLWRGRRGELYRVHSIGAFQRVLYLMFMTGMDGLIDGGRGGVYTLD